MKRYFIAGAFVLALAIPCFALAGTAWSHNWSGYALGGSDFTAVSGSWVISQANASESASGDATWVGIGGLHSSDLIQVGTRAYSQGGSLTYQAWYELLPATSTLVPLTVSAGDRINASINETAPGTWRIAIENASTGEAFTRTVRYASSQSSAEWIEEMPKVASGTLPLIDFGEVDFSNLSAIENGKSVAPGNAAAKKLVLIDTGGLPLATPSTLAGDAFSVARD